MNHRNTFQKGSVRVLVFREGDTWYAVGLELNIVETGDTPQEAMLLLFEAIQGYLESAKKIKAEPSILNQSVEPEYETRWQETLELKLKKRRLESTFFAGRVNINQRQSLVLA